MKVKVRRREPAPIAAEQALKKRNFIFDERSSVKIIRKKTTTFGVPDRVIYDDYKSTASRKRKPIDQRAKQAFQAMLNDKTKPLPFLTDRPISLSDISHK